MTDAVYPDRDMVDIKEAARLLDMSTKTVRRYIKSGRLTATKIRNVWFFSRQELLRMREEDDDASQGGGREIAPAMEAITERLDAIEKLITAYAEQSERTNLQAVREEMDREIRRLTEENRTLQEQLDAARRDLEQLRGNLPKDLQVLKNKIEENAALKATISSNERGLSLLRDEVAAKDQSLRDREAELAQLRERVRQAEARLGSAESPDNRRGGLFGSLSRSRA